MAKRGEGRKEQSGRERALSSSRIIQSSVRWFRTALAEAVHNASEHRLDDAQERPLQGVAIPTRLHQLPALLIKHRKSLWTGPSAHIVPEMVFASTPLKCLRELDRAGADIPEKDPESIDVHRIIILACEKFRGHMDWCPHNAA